MRIQWDSVLVSATAAALDRRFGGARVVAVRLEPEARRLVLWLREATLVWKLHPTEIGLAILPADEPPAEARRLPAKIRSVEAPPDDRVIVFELSRIRGTPSRVALVLELLTNQENALLLEGEERTIRMLLRTREGERAVVRGRSWHPPDRSPRAGVEDDLDPERWRELTAGTDRAERRTALLRQVAWTSRFLADAILDTGDADAELALWRAARGAALGDDPDAPAALVEGRVGPQPFPLALPDRTIETTDDLLDAFRRLEDRAEGSTSLLPAALVARLEDQVARLRGRVASLEEERDGLGDPAEVRALGDLLLARFGEIPAGRDSVELVDFEGNRRTIALDPALRPDENARRYYDRAGRLERAAEQLPALIREAREAWEAAEALLERARLGEADRDEIESAVPDRADRGSGSEDGPTLPYRSYRSSSGREIRVGRGAAKNDDLTFHHSAPNDIWLHARHSAGAHVILRWGRDEHPQPKDLQEAGVLAALHSKARGSGSVPVDWTWRKYVRKPRKAPPGAVLPDRVKTVFVEPDEAVEARLRVD